MMRVDLIKKKILEVNCNDSKYLDDNAVMSLVWDGEEYAQLLKGNIDNTDDEENYCISFLSIEAIRNFASECLEFADVLEQEKAIPLKNK